MSQCDAGDGNVAAAAFLNDLELIFARISAAAGAVDANPKMARPGAPELVSLLMVDTIFTMDQQ